MFLLEMGSDAFIHATWGISDYLPFKDVPVRFVCRDLLTALHPVVDFGFLKTCQDTISEHIFFTTPMEPLWHLDAKYIHSTRRNSPLNSTPLLNQSIINNTFV